MDTCDGYPLSDGDYAQSFGSFVFAPEEPGKMIPLTPVAPYNPSNLPTLLECQTSPPANITFLKTCNSTANFASAASRNAPSQSGTPQCSSRVSGGCLDGPPRAC